jgi:hypothetical protein
MGGFFILLLRWGVCIVQRGPLSTTPRYMTGYEEAVELY